MTTPILMNNFTRIDHIHRKNGQLNSPTLGELQARAELPLLYSSVAIHHSREAPFSKALHWILHKISNTGEMILNSGVAKDLSFYWERKISAEAKTMLVLGILKFLPNFNFAKSVIVAGINFKEAARRPSHPIHSVIDVIQFIKHYKRGILELTSGCVCLAPALGMPLSTAASLSLSVGIDIIEQVART
ncbi:MAG: hypothetical protein QRY72_00480 [Candidatus Rhabdochlamydia sp.]